jgi:hypothetical protein
MFKLVEILIGLILIYVGLERLSNSGRLLSVIFGMVAVLGLVMAVHGILLFNVPDFFGSSM